jgi:hypothetical protein
MFMNFAFEKRIDEIKPVGRYFFQEANMKKTVTDRCQWGYPGIVAILR